MSDEHFAEKYLLMKIYNWIKKRLNLEKEREYGHLLTKLKSKGYSLDIIRENDSLLRNFVSGRVTGKYQIIGQIILWFFILKDESMHMILGALMLFTFLALILYALAIESLITYKREYKRLLKATDCNLGDSKEVIATSVSKKLFALVEKVHEAEEEYGPHSEEAEECRVPLRELFAPGKEFKVIEYPNLGYYFNSL